MQAIDLEMDPFGPKVRFGLWRRRPPAGSDSFLDTLRKEWAKLDIRRRAIDSGRRGLPRLDSMEPTHVEREIAGAFKLLAEEERQLASRKLAEISRKASALGLSITDAAYSNITIRLAGDLSNIETNLPIRLARPMRNWVHADKDLRAFQYDNFVGSSPTTRVVATWLVTTALTAVLEALANGVLFQNELGYWPGVGFAFIVGAGLAVIGTFAGVGTAQLKRRQLWRKVLGAGLLAVTVAAGFLYIAGLASYRHAMVSDGAASAQSGGLIQTLLSSAGGVPLLPFVLINLAGVVVVAWKAIGTFGYLDLKGIESRLARSERRKARIEAEAYSAAEAARLQARSDAENVPKSAQSNADEGQQLKGEAGSVVQLYEAHAEAAAEWAVDGELYFREIVTGIDTALSTHKRFRKPPQPFEPAALSVDPRLETITNGLEARIPGLRQSLEPTLKTIEAAASATKERLREAIMQCEAEARTQGAGSGRILRLIRRESEK
ncbi:MAG TPA: hypothetical protein VF759_05535 [Allosphingosinicella sp.]|jgi:hypothetical protein